MNVGSSVHLISSIQEKRRENGYNKKLTDNNRLISASIISVMPGLISFTFSIDKPLSKGSPLNARTPTLSDMPYSFTIEVAIAVAWAKSELAPVIQTIKVT